MADPEIQHNLKIFGLALAAAVVIWAIIYLLISDTSLVSLWPAWLAALLLSGVALTRPTWLTGLHKIWTRLVDVLNTVITWTLLGTIFIILITPIALIRRLAGKDALKHKNCMAGSYRIKSSPIDSNDMQNPF